jgi:hypothetical protein
MEYSTYCKNFKGRGIPDELENLLHLRGDLETLSAELRKANIAFEFEDSDKWLTDYLGYQSQIVNSLLGIATNGAGDLLAFWLYDDRDLKDAPIVFVGHGDASVIANNFSDLLLLLIACFDLHPEAIPEDLNDETFDRALSDEITLELIEDGTYPPDTMEQLRKRDEEIEQGRAKFLSSLGLQPPQKPAALMRSAIQAHPDFEAWFEYQISIEQSHAADI